MNVKWIMPLVALVVPALAANGYAVATSAGAPTRQDKQWLKSAHRVNLTEIRAGRMAQAKGEAKIVDSAGEMLVSDHKMLDSALTRAAHQLDVPLPDEPSIEQQNLLGRARSHTGDDFDRFWTRTMIDAHQKAINKTKLEIRQGSSAVVTKLAQKALPVLQTHMNMLEHAQSRL